MLDQWTFWRKVENTEMESFGQEVLLLFGVELVVGRLLVMHAVEGFSNVLGCVGITLQLVASSNLSLSRPLMRRLGTSKGRFHWLKHALIRIIEDRPIASFQYRLLILLFFVIHVYESLLSGNTEVGNHRQQHDFSEAVFSDVVVLTLTEAQFRHGRWQIWSQHWHTLSVRWWGPSFTLCAVIKLTISIQHQFIFQIIKFRNLTETQMMCLYLLSSHEHDVTNIEQINPVISVFLTFITWVLSHSKLIPLCLFVKVTFFFHPIDFLSWHEAHFQLFHQLSCYLITALIGLGELALENDVDELLLMFLELNKHLFNIGLVHDFGLEFISDVVTCLGVTLMLALTVLVLTYGGEVF